MFSKGESVLWKCDLDCGLGLRKAQGLFSNYARAKGYRPSVAAGSRTTALISSGGGERGVGWNSGSSSGAPWPAAWSSLECSVRGLRSMVR